MFGLKRDKKELPSLWADGELEKLAVNYETVVNYLLGLSDKDYKIVLEVTAIHRKANDDAAKVTGNPNMPTTFIQPPTELDTNSGLADQYSDKVSRSDTQTLLDGEDDISSAFLDDDHDTPASRAQNKTAKKVTRAKVKSDD